LPQVVISLLNYTKQTCQNKTKVTKLVILELDNLYPEILPI